MKLVNAQVLNFRSVEDSGVFSVDKLTCLVGKNEAGKTAILQALQGLRPSNRAKTKFDVTQEYPRRFVTKFDERHENTSPYVVRTWWSLGELAKAALIEEFGEAAITGNEVTISKIYKASGTSWTVPVSEEKAIENLINYSRFNATEKKVVGHPSSLKQLIDSLGKINDRTEKHNDLLKRLTAYRDQNLLNKAIDIIDPFVPTFFYTSHFDRMSGQISVDQLAKDNADGNVTTEDEIFLHFLELSGTSLDELKSATRYEELIAKCEAASNDITEEIFSYWTQNDSLEVKLDFSEGRPKDPSPFNSGTVVRARVWNTLHRASVPFSERSAGFVWFFSFLVQFAAMRRDAGNVIILLDEPGLTLHGKAQADLLRYIEEKLLSHHQVIFSTHSPFMVPADNLSSVRIVEDVVLRPKTGRPEVKGTKVRSDVLAVNQDTLFPLQGALGYDISQSLFIGKNTILVEGPSDILYLQSFSDALIKRNREGLNSRWTLCPSGGIDKIHPFVCLFGGNHINVAVLSDQATGDKKKIENLRRSQILKSGNLFTAAEFVGKDEADIEDFFEPELFLEIVNATYSLPSKLRLTIEKLSEATEQSPRLIKRVEALCKLLPAHVDEFNHFTPAAWLLRNPQLLESNDQKVLKTLDRAEDAFKKLNALLTE